MAAIWKGAVSFGLVSIPVKLHSATEERGVSFRQVHAADGGRVRYKRVCSVDGAEIAYGEIAKGYELPDGEMVVLTDEDFAGLPLPSQHTIEVLQFVPAEQVDGLYMSRGYYLAADGPGVKPYVLLRDALERSGRVALVKVALRNRESLATLRAREGALLVQTMLWPDEVRDAAAFAPGEDVTVRAQEIAMAESYIETLSTDFDPSAFTDDYRAALEELVAAKAAGREVVDPGAHDAPGPGQVVDLMAALRASVEAARERRAAAGEAPAAPSEETVTGPVAVPDAPSPRARKRSPAKPAAAAAPAEEAAAAGKKKTSAPAGAAARKTGTTTRGAAASTPAAGEKPAAARKTPATKKAAAKPAAAKKVAAKPATSKKAAAGVRAADRRSA